MQQHLLYGTLLTLLLRGSTAGELQLPFAQARILNYETAPETLFTNSKAQLETPNPKSMSKENYILSILSQAMQLHHQKTSQWRPLPSALQSHLMQ